MITLEHIAQGSDAWTAHRATARNASEAPAVMGASPYVTRADLIRRKATGIVPDVDAATQRIFDRGHAVEPLLRAFAEKMAGEDFFPIVATSDDGYLSASFDGVTMDETLLLECKQSNASKHNDVVQGIIPAEDHWQIVQQFAVCETAIELYYVIGDGTNEGTVFLVIPRSRIETDIPKLRAAWAQFDADVAAYQPEAAQPEAIAAPVAGFGVLSLRVEGRVLASNLDGFRSDAEAFIERLPKPDELQTDQDFADADAAAKACAEAETRIKAACDAALAQMADVDSVLRMAKTIGETIRAARLALEKAVSAEKENRRADTIAHYVKQVGEHIAAINKTLGEYAISVPAGLAATIGAAAKGKRTIMSIVDACDQAAANAKIAASQQAETVRQNIAEFANVPPEDSGLFPDRVALAHSKTPEDLRRLIAERIADHHTRAAERACAEADKNRKEHAGVAQSVEHQPSKLDVAGSSPAARSNRPSIHMTFADVMALIPDEKPDLDPVKLRAKGESASEWAQGFNEGWNECRAEFVERLNTLAQAAQQVAA